MIEIRKCNVCKCDIKVTLKTNHRKYCNDCRVARNKINHLTYKGRYNYGRKYNEKYRIQKIFKRINSNIGVYLGNN